MVGASPQTVLFRCDASKSIGSGHVMRCLTLANEIKARGSDVAFQCSDETFQTLPWLADTGFECRALDKEITINWLVVDHYGLDIAYESGARAFANHILVIDDLANRPHDCDVLVDMTYGRNAGDYGAFVPPSCKVLTGADYAMLRPEFLEARKNLPRDFKGNRILVSYGGVNPKGCTEKALLMLGQYRDKPLVIDVVIGGQAAGLDEVKTLVRHLNEDGPHTTALHIDTHEIARLMASADLCLGAGGTTSWERCCLGLPTLTLELADNQTKILRELDAIGALKNLGKIEFLDDRVFAHEFAALIADRDGLETMSKKAKMICDGKGAARVADILCA